MCISTQHIKISSDSDDKWMSNVACSSATVRKHDESRKTKKALQKVTYSRYSFVIEQQPNATFKMVLHLTKINNFSLLFDSNNCHWSTSIRIILIKQASQPGSRPGCENSSYLPSTLMQHHLCDGNSCTYTCFNKMNGRNAQLAN